MIYVIQVCWQLASRIRTDPEPASELSAYPVCIAVCTEVLKGYSLFLIYKTNIFVKLLKLNLVPIWLYFFFIIYFCGIWAFSSSRKHLLITLLRLEFVVLVLYFSIYFYLCNFNYSLFSDDGQRYCPKHVESYSKNKFEKLVLLVGFIIRK